MKYVTPPDSRTTLTPCPYRERQESRIFHALLKSCHGLEDRLADAEPEEVQLIGDLVGDFLVAYLYFYSHISSPSVCVVIQIQKGINASRADDTKGIKGTIIEWITPADQELIPRLHRKHKFDRGFQHDTTGALLCPAGVDWTNPE
jgi:hypothetical protein